MLLGHIVMAAAIGLGAALWPSSAWALGALLIFGSFCAGLLKCAPATFVLLAPLLALRFTEFISGGLIESGAYMSETAAFGQPTGGFTRLLLVYLLFFAAAATVIEAAWPKLRPLLAAPADAWERRGSAIWRASLVAVSGATIYLASVGWRHGFPLLNGMDRFAYQALVDSPVYDFVLRNRIVLAPFIGLVCAAPACRLRGLFLLGWLLVVSIAFGEKFTSLLMILSVSAMPAALVWIAKGRPIPLQAVAVAATVIAAVTLPPILLAYGGAADVGKAATKFEERIALQGQLWYRADADMGRSPPDPQAFAADMASWLQPSEQDATLAGTRFGLYYVMEKFTPGHAMSEVVDTGNGFIFSLYPYLLLTLGWAGMLAVSSLLAAGHAWVMVLLADGLARPGWLAALACVAFARVMSSLYACYSTGFLWNAFGIKTMGTLAIGLLLLEESRRRHGLAQSAGAPGR